MTPSIDSLIEKNDVDTLRALLHKGVLADKPSAEKTAWAYRAARLGRAEALRLLCERCHGLSLAPDQRGQTILHMAASSGDRETMAFAAQTLGMSATLGDDLGVTPLDVAKQKGPEALNALEALCGARLADCYRNPVLRGFRPDPSIVRVENDFYMVNSSFVMLPALPISHSRDLVHWETVGHVFTDPETAALSGLPGGFGYWAPDISYYKGRFWVVATLRRNAEPFRLQMITSAPTPQGPWDAPKFLDVDGIDPSLFADDDGKRYLVVNIGAQIAQISDQGDLLESPRMIWYGWNRVKSEGPHLLKKDGWYYIFMAEGGTGFHHAVTCARSRSLRGPYESCPYNPILSRKNDHAYVGRGGHGKPVSLPDGRWAMVYLCGRQVEGKTLMGRETALDPLTWTGDGWPVVNNLNGPSCLQKKLLPDAPVSSAEPWVCPRLSPDAFSKLAPGGSIYMRGGQTPHDLSGAHLLLRRLREADFILEVCADVRQMEAGSMAGIAGYYDENSYFLLGLRKTAQGADILLVERVGWEERETPLSHAPGWQCRLRLRGRGLTFTAECPEDEKSYSFRCEYLTDEGLAMGKRFTGALLGLCAVGRGEAVFRQYQEDMRDANQ